MPAEKNGSGQLPIPFSFECARIANLTFDVLKDCVPHLQYAKTEPGSVFAYCKQSKTGAGEGLGTRLFHTAYERSTSKIYVDRATLAAAYRLGFSIFRKEHE